MSSAFLSRCFLCRYFSQLGPTWKLATLSFFRSVSGRSILLFCTSHVSMGRSCHASGFYLLFPIVDVRFIFIFGESPIVINCSISFLDCSRQNYFTCSVPAVPAVPAALPAPVSEENPANAAVAAPQEVICFFAHKFASARFTRVISFP